MPINYGSDSACVTDVGLIDQQVINPNLLIGQRIARLLQTPRGGFAAVNDDPTRGWDCRQYINMKLTSAKIAQAQQAIQDECTKDEEVQTATVMLSVAGQQLQGINISLVGANGPFTLVATVDQLTSSLVFSFLQ